MQISNIIRHLNTLKIVQESINWFEDFPEQLWEDYLCSCYRKTTISGESNYNGYKMVDTSIDVFDLPVGALGVEYVSRNLNGFYDLSDIKHVLKFYELIKISTETYIIR